LLGVKLTDKIDITKHGGIIGTNIKRVICGRAISDEDYEDLNSVGWYALWTAALQYNPNRGVKFSTYAFYRTYRLIQQEYYRKQIKHYLKRVTEEDIERYNASGVDTEGMRKYNELIEAANLDDRMRLIVRLIVLEGYTYQEVGDRIGLSKQRVYQIMVVCKEKIRKVLEDE
jgi:RNA polymerase sigma factor (sigma-70 family)